MVCMRYFDGVESIRFMIFEARKAMSSDGMFVKKLGLKDKDWFRYGSILILGSGLDDGGVVGFIDRNYVDNVDIVVAS